MYDIPHLIVYFSYFTRSLLHIILLFGHLHVIYIYTILGTETLIQGSITVLVLLNRHQVAQYVER